MSRLRTKCVPKVCGDALEIGIGSGLNLPFYTSKVCRLYGLDPSLELQRKAAKKIPEAPIQVIFLAQSAEEPMPPKDSTIDTIVMTWSLCSIPNPGLALREMNRVLKPDGRLIYIEHGRSPEPAVAAWQDRITPIWKHIGGGCHLNRRIDDFITESGFQITEQTNVSLSGPRPMTYTYTGVASIKLNLGTG